MTDTPDAVTDPEALRVVKDYLAAYQRADAEGMLDLLAPDGFEFTHYNRGSRFTTREDFVRQVMDWATRVVPDRRYHEIRSWTCVDDVVFLQAIWQGTPVDDLDGRLTIGVEFEMNIKSMFVVREGRIVEVRDHN